jgi:tetratricopeptide (TPR) repeat protein
MPIDLPQSNESQRIDSWKEIAAFFGRDERTVKRWEGQRGLPVHRVPGGRGTVYAFTEELTAWLRSSQEREAQSAVAAVAPGSDATLPNANLPGIAPGPRLPLPDLSGTHRGIAEPANIASPPLVTAAGRDLRNLRIWLILGAALSLIAVALVLVPGISRVRALLGKVFPGVSEPAELAPRKEAEDLYMQGRYHWNKRTPEGLTVALDDFTKATNIDPKYALAYAGQADCYNLLREYTSMPPSQAFPLAIAAATKAVVLDNNLSEAHRALGFAYFYWNWDVAGGEREFRRALALNPKDAEAHHWYATALNSVGRNPEAVAEIEQARKLDPASSSIAADRATVLFSSGREDEAIATLLELEKSEPNFFSPYIYLRNEYFERKEYAKSFDQGERAARMAHDEKAMAAIQVSKERLNNGGEDAMLEGRLADQIAEFRLGNAKAIDVAQTCALLGRNKEAVEYLEKAYQRHEYELITIGFWKGFDGLRSLPEFQDLMRRLGISSAAQSTKHS